MAFYYVLERLFVCVPSEVNHLTFVLVFRIVVIMSYAEKQEEITREEWMDKLNNVHIQRADMNRLIMNYLVTGEENQYLMYSYSKCGSVQRFKSYFIFNRGLQGRGGEVQDGVRNRAQRGPGLPRRED